MIRSYATTFDSERFAAAYVKGAIVIVHKPDGQSCTLSLAESNVFARRVTDYEFDADDRDPIDRACAWHMMHMEHRPWVKERFGVITLHNEPIARVSA